MAGPLYREVPQARRTSADPLGPVVAALLGASIVVFGVALATAWSWL